MKARGNVEKWLLDVEDWMCKTVHHICKEGHKAAPEQARPLGLSIAGLPEKMDSVASHEKQTWCFEKATAPLFSRVQHSDHTFFQSATHLSLRDVSSAPEQARRDWVREREAQTVSCVGMIMWCTGAEEALQSDKNRVEQMKVRG